MSSSNRKLTPKKIVAELDKFIVGQQAAKRSVAIAVRNRWRRQQTKDDLQEEIVPNNIIMVGPTGVGKTEIARRLSKLVDAPFIKVEASKFTEVGYVGRDVESMVRELMNSAFNQTRTRMMDEVYNKVYNLALSRILDALVPEPTISEITQNENWEDEYYDTKVEVDEQLRRGELDDKQVEIPEAPFLGISLEYLIPPGSGIQEVDFAEMLGQIMPSSVDSRKRMKMSVKEAINYYVEAESNRMVSKDKIIEAAREAVENDGIIFIDEIDKIASKDIQGQVDVSRSGVQRDLLPIVEGSVVPTKYGPVNTSHILFIAAGAFHTVKPSDLIPELQGRFPIRVELQSLTQEDFERILVEPENSLVKQYQALFAAEKCELTFQKKAISEIAKYAALANEKMEDIGARRLHTIMNTLLDEYLFQMPSRKLKEVKITPAMVREKVSAVIESEDLARFIL